MEKQLILDPHQLTPSHPTLKILGAFNPGVITFGQQTIMIARIAECAVKEEEDKVLIPVFRNNRLSFISLSKSDPKYNFSDARVVRNGSTSYLTSLSHFWVGRSLDGINFSFKPEDRLLPSTIYEEYGMEDPRISKIGKSYYITYSAVSSYGINVSLMVTDDFISFRRLGNILPFDNKDCVIFPRKINNKYYALHRPSTSEFGKLDIWLAESSDLRQWGNHKVLVKARISYDQSVRIGGGATPFLIDEGWVVVYHSADKNNRYHLTAMILDKDDPSKVIMRGTRPLIEPTEVFEKNGFMKNVVFTCGLIRDHSRLFIYYGACDEKVAMATLTIKDLLATLEVVQ